MEQVLIFKTSVNSQEHVREVKALLQPIRMIQKWTFDLDDCDKILRIVSFGIRPQLIENVLRKAGIYCEHLEYEL